MSWPPNICRWPTMWKIANSSRRRPVTAMICLAPIDERAYRTSQVMSVGLGAWMRGAARRMRGINARSPGRGNARARDSPDAAAQRLAAHEPLEVVDHDVGDPSERFCRRAGHVRHRDDARIGVERIRRIGRLVPDDVEADAAEPPARERRGEGRAI